MRSTSPMGMGLISFLTRRMPALRGIPEGGVWGGRQTSAVDGAELAKSRGCEAMTYDAGLLDG